MSVFSSVTNFVKDHAKTIGVVASTVTAFAATAVSVNKAIVKVDEVKKEYEEHIKVVEMVLANEDIPEEKYSKEDAENDIRIITTQKTAKTFLAFVPTLFIVGFSALANCVIKPPYILIGSISGGTIGFIGRKIINSHS